MAPSEVQLEQSLHKVETQSSTFSSLMCSKQQVAALSQLSYPTLTVNQGLTYFTQKGSIHSPHLETFSVNTLMDPTLGYRVTKRPF